MATLNNNSAEIEVTTKYDGDGVEQGKNDLKGLGKTGEESEAKLTSFTDSFSKGLTNVAKFSAVAGAGLTLFAKTSVDKLTDVVKSSRDLGRQTGMTTEESSKLVAAMGRVGVSSDMASIAFRTLSKTIANSREDTKDMGNKLNEMHIATKNADGSARGFNDILLDVSDRFKDMPDGAEKTALALELFGRSGTSMIKVLNGGSEAITKLGEDAEKLGLTLTSENINTVDKYIKSQKEMAQQTQALQMQVGMLTAPILTEFQTQLNGTVQSLIGVDGPLRDATVGVLAFGGPVLGATAATAEFAANIAGAIPMLRTFGALVGTPLIMPAIAVGAAIASLVLVGDKISETIAAIEGMNDAQDQAKKTSEAADAAMKKAYEEGRISLDKYNTYLKQSEQNSYMTKDRLYTGFFGPLLKSGADLVSLIQGKSMQEVYGSDKKSGKGGGGFASGGYTGRGGVNEAAGIVHKGEYVVKQADVDQRTGMPKPGAIGGGSTTSQTFHIANVNLGSAGAVREFLQADNRSAQLASMGLAGVGV